MKISILIRLIILIALMGCSDNKKVEYYQDGEKKAIYTIKNGKRKGPFKKFYKNGRVKEKGFYKFGAIHDTLKKYYSNGNLMCISPMKDGKRIKRTIYYYKNGNIEQEMFYKKGKHVLTKIYNRKGNIINIKYYDEFGNLVGINLYDQKGNRIKSYDSKQVVFSPSVNDSIFEVGDTINCKAFIANRNHNNDVVIALVNTDSINKEEVKNILYKNTSHLPMLNDSVAFFSYVPKEAGNYIIEGVGLEYKESVKDISTIKINFSKTFEVVNENDSVPEKDIHIKRQDSGFIYDLYNKKM